MSVNTQYLFSISGTRALSQIFYGLSLWQLEVKLTPEKKLVQGRAAEFYTRRPKTLSLNKKIHETDMHLCTYVGIVVDFDKIFIISSFMSYICLKTRHDKEFLGSYHNPLEISIYFITWNYH